MTELNDVKRKVLKYDEYCGTIEILDDLYKKSRKGMTFNKLYELIIDENNIMRAYRTIKRNTGSKTKGVNGHTIKYLENLTKAQLINLVRCRLSNYKPNAVRRVFIPKPNGKQRPLGIPTIEDRLIQQCILQILQPICEAKFHKSSFGFRLNRSTHHAIARCNHLINHSKNHFVVDLNIKGFFDNVCHGKLMKQIWSIGIQDKRVLCIISKMLKSEIVGEGVSTKGLLQGGILSPLLANIVLNELDWWISDQWETFKTKRSYNHPSSKIVALKSTKLKPCYIVRYADDFKIFTDSRTNAKKLFVATKQWLNDRLKLEVSEEKSKIKEVYKSKLKKLRKSPCPKNANALNGFTLGIHNYYKVATDVATDFRDIMHWIYPKYKNLKRRGIITENGVPNKVHETFYSGYNHNLPKCCGITLYPIEYVHFKKPVQIHPELTPYTKLGRERIHNKLTNVSPRELEALRTGNFGNRSIEYIENRISKFVGQNGKCYITGIRLNVKDVHCHHIKPLKYGGNDRYENLIIVHKEIHKLIHSTNINNIIEQSLDWTTKSKSKFNKLRQEANLEKINFNIS